MTREDIDEIYSTKIPHTMKEQKTNPHKQPIKTQSEKIETAKIMIGNAYNFYRAKWNNKDRTWFESQRQKWADYCGIDAEVLHNHVFNNKPLKIETVEPEQGQVQLVKDVFGIE